MVRRTKLIRLNELDIDDDVHDDRDWCEFHHSFGKHTKTISQLVAQSRDEEKRNIANRMRRGKGVEVLNAAMEMRRLVQRQSKGILSKETLPPSPEPAQIEALSNEPFVTENCKLLEYTLEDRALVVFGAHFYDYLDALGADRMSSILENLNSEQLFLLSSTVTSLDVAMTADVVQMFVLPQLRSFIFRGNFTAKILSILTPCVVDNLDENWYNAGEEEIISGSPWLESLQIRSTLNSPNDSPNKFEVAEFADLIAKTNLKKLITTGCLNLDEDFGVELMRREESKRLETLIIDGEIYARPANEHKVNCR